MSLIVFLLQLLVTLRAIAPLARKNLRAQEAHRLVAGVANTHATALTAATAAGVAEATSGHGIDAHGKDEADRIAESIALNSLGLTDPEKAV